MSACSTSILVGRWTVVLEVSNVTGGYGNMDVLHGVSLSIRQGERVGLLGRNGVGKTTLMRCLAGLTKVRNGRIRFNGRDLTEASAHERARQGISLVPQGRWIFPALSVGENLRVASRASGRRAHLARMDFVLEQFPALVPKLNAFGGSLSGGQQQILALGRALMTDPKLLLLDEPSEGIQPSVVSEIEDHIIRLNKTEGLTVLLVEQNLEMAVRMTTRCYLMDHGQVMREIPSAQILTDKDLQHEYMGI